MANITGTDGVLRFNGARGTIEWNPTTEELKTLQFHIGDKWELRFPYMRTGEITPVKYLAPARIVLREITLDPASSSFANRVVMAKEYYTASSNSFAWPWVGKVWLNPPWHISVSDNVAWISKLAEEFACGNTTAAIMLLPVSNFRDIILEERFDEVSFCLCQEPFALCDKEYSNAEGGVRNNIFVYVGDDHDRFVSVFAQFGNTFKLSRDPVKSKPWSYDATL